jgi:MATE family, multidrug efflux pump
VSTFLYAIVFTRLGTNALAANQIVLSLESVFIVASAGLAPAAVAVMGHALGVGSLQAAKASAWLTVRFGLITAWPSCRRTDAALFMNGATLIPMVVGRFEAPRLRKHVPNALQVLFV